MKTTSKIIVYDDTCPMCNWYTGVFIKTGLLEKDGRQSFTEIKPELINLIDAKQCRNEIPLIDTANNKVYYGTDALLEILGAKFPWLKKIFSYSLPVFFIKKLYKLISYNRRTIVAPITANSGFDCKPDFNINYRILLIILGLSMNTLLLFPLHRNVLGNSLLSSTSLMQLQMAHLFLVCTNLFATLFMKRNEAIEYLGQINMLAIITSLSYLPLIALNKMFIVPPFINNAWLMVMLFIILREYFRRMNFAGVLLVHENIISINMFCLIAFVAYLIN